MKCSRMFVKEKAMLLEFLLKNINNSKNSIKTILKNGNIFVNDKTITRYDYILDIGDIVEVKSSYDVNNSKIEILYEDEYLIIVNKESGLLTISTEREKDKTLYKYISSYVKNKNKNSKIFIVNRLDKDTSGIVVFAKSENIKNILQNNWNESVKLREYVAVVHGVTKEHDVIKSYLKENREFIVYSTNDKSGKFAITEYNRLKYNNYYSLLKINLHTGRKNQIRVHMKDISHPIVGDRKYGVKDLKCRLMLHSSKLFFIHPISSKEIKISCNYPDSFDNMF